MRTFVRKSTDLFKKNYLKEEGSGQHSSRKGGKKSSSHSFFFSRDVCPQIKENVEEICPFLCASLYDWCSYFTFKSIYKVGTQRTHCLRSICRWKKTNFAIWSSSFFHQHIVFPSCSQAVFFMMNSALFQNCFLGKDILFLKTKCLFIRFSSPPRS